MLCLPPPEPTGEVKVRILRWTMLAVLLASAAGALGLWLGGYRAYVVHTGSMEPTLDPGYLILDGPPVDRVHPGQVITFRHSDVATDVVTHRVAALIGPLIETKGDANRTPDPWRIRPSQVKGRMVLSIPYAGYAAVYFEQPVGGVSLVVVAVALVLLWQLFFPDPRWGAANDAPGQRDGVPLAGAAG